VVAKAAWNWAASYQEPCGHADDAWPVRTHCTTCRAAGIYGFGRSAALQILALATASTVVCALHPIPNRSACFAAKVMQSVL